MSARLSLFSSEIEFPASVTPEWAPLVERWYQLDAAAFALAETYWRHRAELGEPPVWILLCSPAASNATDSQFALSAPSPAKFVHTLPNIRSAALLQVMAWAGPVLCVQNDPNTILTGLREGLSFFDLGEGNVWIASVTAPRASIAVLSENGPLKIAKSRGRNMANPSSNDRDWLSWISQPKNLPFHGNGLTIE